MTLPRRSVTAFALVLIGSASPAADQPPAKKDAAPTAYELVWADEFDRDGKPSQENWGYESGFVRNEELQWYQPDNARCEGGLLIIEGRREKKPNPTYVAGASDWKRKRESIEYTASSLITRGKHSWQYGRFEMRGRIDTSPGMWPAFWTLGVEGRWPANGEIDIMEYYRGNVLANVAWAGQGRGATWDAVKKPVAEFNDPNWSSKFHVWRMDWDADRIQLFLDDSLLNSTELKDAVNRDGKNPFRQPHYILLNLAIGGQNGGDPSKTAFPSKFEVDYVRVYREKKP